MWRLGMRSLELFPSLASELFEAGVDPEFRQTGVFNGLNGVAVASDGSVYVSDRNNHRVQKFSPAP
jgi:DNA-binding beta-propeller fold protein YncE